MDELPGHNRTDGVLLPATIFAVYTVAGVISATGYHGFDGLSYIWDMGKPFPALVLPHHLVYEPTVLGFFRLWQALGWEGKADLPAQLLSTLAGAGGLALLYKLASEWGRSRVAALVATLLAAVSYGYWYYSVEVDIYTLPLFFVLLAAWLAGRVFHGAPWWLLVFSGLSHATAVLYHQVAVLLAPAFVLAVVVLHGRLTDRVGKGAAYGIPFALVVATSYVFSGVVIAGQNSAEGFWRWLTNYGQLGTWGGWRPESVGDAVGGISASLSADYWTGRLGTAFLLLLAFVGGVFALRRLGAMGWLLRAWMLTYGLFFTWWHPEALKFWVLFWPAPLLLGVAAARVAHPRVSMALLGAAGAGCLLLFATNAPVIWERRDPMSDPARQVSDALARMSGPEDLVLLQAGSEEIYLPFYYERRNVMSARELWYELGGRGRSAGAVVAIRERMWHALAKGERVWIDERVVTAGSQKGDHFVFTQEEVESLLSPYGAPVPGKNVKLASSEFVLLEPGEASWPGRGWEFRSGRQGWSGVNIAGDTVGEEGWCFTPGDDPALYGPPLKTTAVGVTLRVSSTSVGDGQLFFRASARNPYREESSVRFDLEAGEKEYTLDFERGGVAIPLGSLRLDPTELGQGPGERICVREITLRP